MPLAAKHGARPKRRSDNCLVWWSTIDLAAHIDRLQLLRRSVEAHGQIASRGLLGAIDDAVVEYTRRR
jgi:hypothetical protein